MKPKTCAAIAVFLVLLILGFLIWSLSAPDPRPWSQGFQSEQERTEIRAKMAHHGILSAILDRETGETYFMREGKVCKL